MKSTPSLQLLLMKIAMRKIRVDRVQRCAYPRKRSISEGWKCRLKATESMKRIKRLSQCRLVLLNSGRVIFTFFLCKIFCEGRTNNAKSWQKCGSCKGAVDADCQMTLEELEVIIGINAMSISKATLISPTKKSARWVN